MRWFSRRRRPSLRSIQVLRLEPGDTVVLEVEETLSKQRAEEVDAILRGQFPGHNTLVLHGGWKLSTIRPTLPENVQEEP